MTDAETIVVDGVTIVCISDRNQLPDPGLRTYTVCTGSTIQDGIDRYRRFYSKEPTKAWLYNGRLLYFMPPEEGAK
mgnify:CR=1 FL=1